MMCMYCTLVDNEVDRLILICRQADQRQDFIYESEGLQLLSRIWFVFSANENMMCKLAGM